MCELLLLLLAEGGGQVVLHDMPPSGENAVVGMTGQMEQPPGISGVASPSSLDVASGRPPSRTPVARIFQDASRPPERPGPSPPSAQRGLNQRGQGVGKAWDTEGFGVLLMHHAADLPLLVHHPLTHSAARETAIHSSSGRMAYEYGQSYNRAVSVGVAVVMQHAHALLLRVLV